MLSKQKKEKLLSDIDQGLKKSNALFLVGFTGINVGEVTEFRKQLHSAKGQLKIVKNKIAHLATQKNEEFKSLCTEPFVGDNAFVFAYEDASEVAKVISQNSKKCEALRIKWAILNGKQLEKQEVQRLASLPSKDVLRAQLLNLFKAPMTQLVRVMNEVPTSFVRLLANKAQDQKE